MLSRYRSYAVFPMLDLRERASTGRFEIQYRNQRQNRAEEPPEGARIGCGGCANCPRGVSGGSVNFIRMWARQFADRRPNVVSRSPRKIARELSRLRYWPWFRDKQLTTDWTSESFTLWRGVLSPLRKKTLRILEIGVVSGS
jgi:hypothetical protein